METDREQSRARHALITIEQHDTARALARSFGHRWASERDAPSALAYTDRVRYGGAGIDTAEIARAAVADAPENTIGGIYAPSVNADGDVEHTTGSGRLRYVIAPTGSVTLYVYRPAGEDDPEDAGIPTLRAIVANHTVDMIEAVRDSQSGRACARHWQALVEALTPLVGYEAAWNVLLPHVGPDVRLSMAPYNGSTLWTLVDAGAPAYEAQPGDVLPPPALVFPPRIRSLAEAFGMLRVESPAP